MLAEGALVGRLRFVIDEAGIIGTGLNAVATGHAALIVHELLAGIPFSRWVVRASERLVNLTDGSSADAASEPVELSALDESMLDKPQQALANAAREVVGVCETVEIMLQRVIELYEHATEEEIKALARMDDRIDEKHASIKLYLARVNSRPLSQDEALRCQELVGACVKLEQVGDIIVRNLLVHVRRKKSRNLEFTTEGWRELATLHGFVLANARLAFNLLISRDCDTAARLVREKDRLRELERTMSQKHFERLSDGTERSIETSSLHLDTMRDLKQINSLLVSIAYPVLEEHGLLRSSRLTRAARQSAE